MFIKCTALNGTTIYVRASMINQVEDQIEQRGKLLRDADKPPPSHKTVLVTGVFTQQGPLTINVAEPAEQVVLALVKAEAEKCLAFTAHND